MISLLKYWKNTLNRILIIGFLLLSFLVVIIIDYFKVPDVDDQTDFISLIIPKGASIQSISDSLFIKNLINDREIFILWLTTLDKDRLIKAGFYEVPMDLTYAQLINFLTHASSKEIRVTLIEGWHIEDFAEEFSSKLDLNKDKFLELCRDSVFIRKSGLNIANLEGYLLPDTYHFYWGVDEGKVLEFLVNECKSIFNPAVMSKLDQMKMNIHEIIILASIIEGEAIFDDEREIISSVYHNRLRRRIKLQADPTIQYILEGPPRRLLLRDLEIDSPYNTYKYYGLPPGPISNPGKKSILAAIYPADTNYIYFVAKGDGRHTFSRNAAEHIRAKAEFDKVRREISRKKRATKK